MMIMTPIELQSLDSTRLLSPELANRIATVFETTQTRTRARSKALSGIKWRLKVCGLTDSYVMGTLGIHWKIGPAHRALVFDGRDNEQQKIRYYQAITGLPLEVELV